MRYDPSACRVSVRAGHSLVHVTLWHPNWGSAATAALRSALFGGEGPAEGAAPDVDAARVMLDEALGTEQVATWIGDVEVTDTAPTDAIGMDELADLLDRRATEASGPDGEPEWATVTFDDGSARTVVPLARAVAPSCDVHAVVALEVDLVASSDLTAAQIDECVLMVQDALADALAENAAGRIVAVVTTDATGPVVNGGTGGTTAVHMYLDSDVPGVDGAVDPDGDRSVLNTLRAVASTWDIGDSEFDAQPDPTWDAVHYLRA
ncbi:MAG TPA: hypothetical protein H9870_00660 [Candidatus Corynebacterium avicola]|uniref:Uncharacterized protein n=1 Tax=Candidatus Corynebacterium avicola TaxID=2838527 RepID=A0A9D1RMG1_9CORY|nr:hypothetical protein [Candidatus Corynebacterium avicola]